MVLPLVFSRTVERFVIAVTAVACWLVVAFGEDRRLRVIGQEGRERRQLLQGVQPKLRQQQLRGFVEGRAASGFTTSLTNQLPLQQLADCRVRVYASNGGYPASTLLFLLLYPF